MALAETAKLAVDMSLTGNFKSALAGNERALSSFTTKVDSVAMRGVGGIQTGLGKIETAVGKFGGAIGHAKNQIGGLLSGPLGLIGLGAGLFTIGGALEHGITKAQEFGDEVYKLKAITGLSAESVSALAAGLEHFGISGDTAIRSIGLLEKNVGLLASRKGAIADFEKTFGLAVTDANGKVKDANELILTTADYFNNKAIPAQTKAAAIAKLYGRSWQQLLPALIAGRRGIMDAEVAAKDLGLTLTEANVGALAKFRAATRELGTAVGGLELQIGLALVPALTDLAKVATSFVAHNRDKIVQFFKDAAHFAQELGAVIKNDVVPVFGAIATGWNAIPKEVRDLVIAGLVGNKIIKWTFGFSPITFVAGSIEKGLGAILGKFIGKGVVQPVFVTNQIPGGGLPGGPAAGGEGLLSKVLALGIAGAIVVAAVPIGKAFADALPDWLKGPGGQGKSEAQLARERADAAKAAAAAAAATASAAKAAAAAASNNRTPASILDRGGREQGFNALAGKIVDDKVAVTNAIRSFAASLTTTQRSALATMNRQLASSGTVASKIAYLNRLQERFAARGDTTLQNVVKGKISALQSAENARLAAVRDKLESTRHAVLAGAAKVAGSAMAAGAVARKGGDHAATAVNALRSAQVAAQRATTQAVKDKDLSVRITVPITNRTYVNSRNVITTVHTLTNFYSLGAGVHGLSKP